MTQKPIILSVAQITSLIKQQIEGPFQKVWIQGEIANFKQASSGHFYFSLAGEGNMINAVLFRAQAARYPLLPKNGDIVIAEGEISVFAAKGSYQLIVRSLELGGLGAKLLAKEMLKRKLSSLGWFAKERKRPLPSSIKTIGVITSPTGAVIKDIIHILSRRSPSFSLLINPVAVQGDEASRQIAQAIQEMNRLHLCDLLIICRGGGSSEDLAAFDTEEVAKACFESQIPTISAVGHETDTTLLDLVADVRAPTPSAAAELASHEKRDLSEKMALISQSLIRACRAKLVAAKVHLDTFSKRLLLVHPARKIINYRMALASSHEELYSEIQLFFLRKKESLILAKKIIRSQAPIERLCTRKKELAGYYLTLRSQANKQQKVRQELMQKMRKNLVDTWLWHITLKKNQLHNIVSKQDPVSLIKKKTLQLQFNVRRIASHLASCNPWLPLSKGYALIKGSKEQVCSSIHTLIINEKVSLIFSDGLAHAVIKDVHAKGTSS